MIVLAAIALLLPLLLACESNDSPFRESPDQRVAAQAAAEQQLEQSQAQAEAGAASAGEEEAAQFTESTATPDPDTAAEPDPSDAELSGDERDPEAPPPTKLDGFLALRFPEHEEFSTFAIELPAGGDRSLVFAYSRGDPAPPGGHVAGIFEVEQDRVAARQTIGFDPADGLFSAEIEQLFVDASDGRPWGRDLWFWRRGPLGAHGSGADLIRWNPDDLSPAALRIELSWNSALPGAAMALVDIDSDGSPEIWLDDTDAFVLCYACGVREPGFQIARWSRDALVITPLTRLGAGALGPAREAVNFAIDLAEANLWSDALEAIAFADRLAPGHPTIAWNTLLLREAAQVRRANAGDGFPLLTHLYAGQFEAAVSSLAGLRPIDLLDLFGPLTRGTVAEGWEQTVAETLFAETDAALSLQPQLAPALFLRGLARFWLAPDAPHLAITDINSAAALDPAQPLYEALANLLTP